MSQFDQPWTPPAVGCMGLIMCLVAACHRCCYPHLKRKPH
jgi:hypothetical protein